ncbi:MAG: MucR family transcriptional regulator [Alphaproteobacteria bacterium]|nr:MucR family transcriptional regulator [Alphaproteobacteria bacterium]
MTNHVTALGANIATSELLNLTTEIVASYVSNNNVEANDLTDVVKTVYATLSELAAGRSTMSSARPEPAIAVKKSIADDYIVCLEDGKKLKMLKRHLKSAYNMSPEQYRERWNLAPDYPMVAPSYARQRSQLAKNIGLGTRSRRGEKQAA